MAKPFRSDKRKKELQRLKKQEEKRQRRFGIKPETTDIENKDNEFGELPDNQNNDVDAEKGFEESPENSPDSNKSEN